MNPLRTFIQKIGFDLHRYYPQIDSFAYIREYNIKTVLDIGANIGQFAREARDKIPEAHIHSFEPLPDCFSILSKTFAHDPFVTMYNYALGDKNDVVTMHASEYRPSSSLLPMSDIHKKLFPHTTSHTEQKIEIKRLDDVVEALPLEKEIIIKVDVQGFEDKVITGGIHTFQRARVAIIKTSFFDLYEHQPSFDDIYYALKRLGFIYKGALQQKKNKDNGEIISEDSLFVR